MVGKYFRELPLLEQSERFTTMSDDPSTEIFLTDVELAERWGVRLNLLQRWRHGGKGPKWVKIVGTVRYPLQYIRAYEEEQTRTATTKRKVA